jgi:hypothetical protein
MCVPAIWWERKNNSLFNFYVYFEGSPPAEEPWGIMPRKRPQFYMFPCPQGNISFSMKQERSEEIQKSVVNGKGVFQYSCILLRLGNTLELAHLGAPPTGGHTPTGTSPFSKMWKHLKTCG